MSILTLIKKDFKIVLSDRKALLILIAMPIILFTILSFALAGSFESNGGKVWTVKLGIVKLYDIEDDKRIIKDLMKHADIDSEKEISFEKIENILFEILDDDKLDFIDYEIMSFEEAKKRLDENELASIVILPKHYVSDLVINMSPSFRKRIDIKIIKNNDKQYSSAIVENIITEISNRQSQMMISNKVSTEVLNYYNVNQEVIEQFILKAQAELENSEELKIEIEDYKIDRLKMVNSGQYYSVAMMAMFLLFGASYGAKFMLEEKKNFTLQRQYVGGLSAIKIVFGKMAIIYIIAFMQISLMIITSTLGFRVYWGNPVEVFLLTLLSSFGVMGLGSILAVISLKIDSLKAINILESGIFQVVALFGGSYLPIYMMPDWLQSVSKIILNGAILDAYLKVMMDAPLNDILFSLLSIILNGVVFIIIASCMISKGIKNKVLSLTKDEVV
jgi:ABC-type multidrug transport system permease subunit